MAATRLPTSSYQASNYYVDPVFTPSASGSAVAVIARSPADTATGVALTAPVTGTFNAAIDQGTLQFGVTGPGGAAVAGAVSYDATSRKATFQPTAALSYGSTYSVSLAAVGTSGAAMAQPSVWTFTTVPAPVPTVSGQAPASGATGVPISSAVSAVFSDAMDASTLAFTLKTAAGSAVPGTFVYDAVTKKVTLTPTASLATSTVYTATLSGKSTFGAAMAAPVSWSFTTAAPPAAPPTVTAQSPASGATGASLTANITGTFDSAVTSSTIVLTLKDPSGTVVPGSLTYSASTRTATLNPTASLAYATTYTASLSATGTNGAAMVAPVTWSFTTVAAPVPTVGSLSPASGASGVAVTATVRGTFSIAVDPTSMSFTVSGPSGAVAGSASYNSSTRVATFTPTTSLAYGAAYTAQLKATGTAGGAMAAPATWSFTTVAPVVPTVSAQAPASGATAVASTAVVTGRFSVAITESTLSFVVKDSTGANVPGAVTYVAGTRVATFTPSPKLSYSTTYTATLSATSSQGGAMAAPATWSFTTNDPTTTYSLMSTTTTPATASVATTATSTVGLTFYSAASGSVTGVRFYAGPANTGPQPVALWNSAGATKLASGTSTATGTGWRTVMFASPVAITSGTTYVVTYTAPAGGYSVTNNDLLLPRTSGQVRTATQAGRLGSGTGFPSTRNYNNYFVDVLVAVPNA